MYAFTVTMTVRITCGRGRLSPIEILGRNSFLSCFVWKSATSMPGSRSHAYTIDRSLLAVAASQPVRHCSKHLPLLISNSNWHNRFGVTFTHKCVLRSEIEFRDIVRSFPSTPPPTPSTDTRAFPPREACFSCPSIVSNTLFYARSHYFMRPVLPYRYRISAVVEAKIWPMWTFCLTSRFCDDHDPPDFQIKLKSLLIQGTLL